MTCCPLCRSDDRRCTKVEGTKYSGITYYNMGLLCLNGWHDYPYAVRLESGHYEPRRPYYPAYLNGGVR